MNKELKLIKKMFLQQMIKWRHGVFYVIICSNFYVNLRIDMLISNGKKYDIEDDWATTKPCIKSVKSIIVWGKIRSDNISQ